MEASENSQRNSRSITIATNPQSWSSCNERGETEKYQYTINIDVPVSAFHVVAMHRRTNRIEIVLSLHVVLDEHYIVHCLLQFERVLFPSLNVTHRFVQPRHHRRQSIVAAQSSETTAQGSHQATETESLRLIESQLVP